MPSIVNVTSAIRCVNIDLQELGVSYNQMNFIDHLPRAISQILKVIGNDLVLNGLTVTAECINGKDIIFKVSPGMLIQDLTLIEVIEQTQIIFKDANLFDTSKGRFVVHTDFQYMDYSNVNNLKFAVSFVDQYGITDGRWYPDKNRIVLDSFKTQKDSVNSIALLTSSFFGQSKIQEITYVVVENKPIQASGAIEGTHSVITYTSKLPGTIGNLITVDQSISESLSINNISVNVIRTVEGYTIEVYVPKDGATAKQIVDAVNNNTDAKVLVTASYNEFGSDVNTGIVHLAGGVDSDITLGQTLDVVDSDENKIILFDEVAESGVTSYIDLPCKRFVEIYSKKYYQYGYTEDNITLLDYIKHIVQCFCEISSSTNSQSNWISSENCPCSQTKTELGDYFLHLKTDNLFQKQFINIEDNQPDPFNLVSIFSCEFKGKSIFKDYSSYNRTIQSFNNISHSDEVYKYPPSSIKFSNIDYINNTDINKDSSNIQFLRIPFDPMFNFNCNGFTIILDINFSSLKDNTQYSFISLKENGTQGYWRIYYIHNDTDNGSEIIFEFDDYSRTNIDNTIIYKFKADYNFSINTWYNIIVSGICSQSDSKNKILIFIDKNLISSTNYNYIPDNYRSINIGIYDELDPYPFDGYMSSIQIYNRTLWTNTFDTSTLIDRPPTCSGYSRLLWDPKNSDVIGNNSILLLRIMYGRAPFVWSINSDKFTLDYNSTSTRSNILRSTDSSCGSVIVSVTDFNGDVVSNYVRSVNGVWVVSNKSLDTPCQMPTSSLINPDDIEKVIPVSSINPSQCIDGYLENRFVHSIWELKKGNKLQIEQTRCDSVYNHIYTVNQIPTSKLTKDYTWDKATCYSEVDDDLCIAPKCQRGFQPIQNQIGKNYVYHIKLKHLDSLYYEWECGYKRIYWDYSSEPYVETNTDVVLKVRDGLPPFRWSVISPDTGFTINTEPTMERYNVLKIGSDILLNTKCIIKVEDRTKNYCYGDVTIVGVYPVIRDVLNVEVVSPDSFIQVYIKNGQPPFRWEILNNPDNAFSFRYQSTMERVNSLNAESYAKGSVDFKVTDSNDTSFTWSVRSAVGTWIRKGFGCPVSRIQGILMGIGTIYNTLDDGKTESWEGPLYELVTSKYKIRQVVYNITEFNLNPYNPEFDNFYSLENCNSYIDTTSPTCIDFKDYPDAGIRCSYAPIYSPYIPNIDEVYKYGYKTIAYGAKTEYYEWGF